MVEPLDIVCYPDPILRHPTTPVGEVTEEIRKLIPVLMASMKAAKGLGLAANQVGIGKRLALVSDSGDERDTRIVIDPEIVETGGAIAVEEGCLSFPGLTGLITRPEEVRVRYTNLEGETVEEETDGLLARCFLHEIDHLDGILFISKMTPADRIRLKRSLRDLEEEFAG